jgi:DNA-binding NarL/FixJ family response regulator
MSVPSVERVPKRPTGPLGRRDAPGTGPTDRGRSLDVLLCDRATLFREGLARLLRANGSFRVIASTHAVAAAVREAKRQAPDLIVAGTEMVDGTIDDLARRLLDADCASRIVALCSEGEPCANFGVPVDGAVRRSASLETLLDTLLDPASGPARDVPPRPRPLPVGPCAEAADTDRLAPRMLCVLTLVARGWPNRDIARWLGLREKTVRDYLTDAYRALGVRSCTEAALAMLQRGYGPEVQDRQARANARGTVFETHEEAPNVHEARTAVPVRRRA